jgi:hypothetical protein
MFELGVRYLHKFFERSKNSLKFLLLLYLLLLFLSACTNSVPVINSLNLKSSKFQVFQFQTDVKTESLVSDDEGVFNFSIGCSKNMSDLEYSDDKGTTWQSMARFECTNGRSEIKFVATKIFSDVVLLRISADWGDSNVLPIVFKYRPAVSFDSVVGLPTSGTYYNTVDHPFTIIVKAGHVSGFIYKIGNSASIDCLDSFGYGESNVTAGTASGFNLASSSFVSSLPEGEIKICLRLKTDKEYVTRPADAFSLVYTNDSVDPMVSITTPAQNAKILKNSVNAYTIAGTCSDNNQNVDLKFNVSVINYSGICSSGNWISSLDLSALSDGPVSVAVNQTDFAGNISTTATMQLFKDTIEPNVTAATTSIAANALLATGTVPLFVVFNDNIFVDTSGGIPRIELNLTPNYRFADYVSGNGSNTLVFNYVIGASEQVAALDYTSISALQLNGGRILDLSGNDATLTLPAVSFGLKNIRIDSLIPSVSSLVGPSNGTYNLGSNLVFTATFNESMVATGTSRIAIDIGSSTQYALITNGTNQVFNFSYTVGDTDFDANGIATIGTLIELNGGALKDIAGNNAVLSFVSPNLNGVYVDGVVPLISGGSAPNPMTYKIGDDLNFVLNFSENVFVINTPTLSLTIGGVKRPANYIAGSGGQSLNFKYTIVESDNQSAGGISVGTLIGLNGGTVKDSAGNNSNLNFSALNTSGVLVDGIKATVATLAGPSSGTYIKDQFLIFSATFSESVVVGTISGVPNLALTIGGNNRFADYYTSAGSMVGFKYQVAGDDQDSDGITVGTLINLNGGSILDLNQNQALLNFMAPQLLAVKVDGILPVIDDLLITNATYKKNDTIVFTATFSENVFVNAPPRIALSVGSINTFAIYYSGTGTQLIQFNYTVQNNDLDINGVTIGTSVQLNSGTIRDAAGNMAVLDFGVIDTSGIKVDGETPYVTGATGPAPNTFSTAQAVNIDLTFNEVMHAINNPRLPLTVGATTRYADYVSGSDSMVLRFAYIVQNGDLDTNGISASGSIDLSGGTLADLAGNIASTTYSLSLAGINIDGSSPSIISMSGPSVGSYSIGAELIFSATFDEVVSVVGNPRLIVSVDTFTRYANFFSLSSNVVNFKYTVAYPETDKVGGISIGSLVDLSTGTIEDATQNLAVPSFTPPLSLTGIVVDTINPIVNLMSAPTTGTYITGGTLDFIAYFDEPIEVSGSPRLILDVGGGVRYATYSAPVTNGTMVKLRYVVLANDFDSDGVSLTSASIDVSNGTIRDGALNFANLSFSVPGLTNVKIDAVKPNISAVYLASGTYLNSNTIVVSATYSESVSITGVPKLPLLLSSGTVMADYVSVSSGSILIFNYTIGSSDYDWDGSISSGTSLNLTGGTIKDTAGNITNLNFGPNTHSGVYVDGSVPNIIGLAWPSSGTYMGGTNLVVTATFSESVALTGTPSIDLQLTSGTVKAYTSAGTGTTFSFTHSIGASDVDNDGIATEGTYVLLNGGSIKDLSGNNALLNFANPSLSSVKVDGVVPTIISGSITYPSANTYIIGGTLDFTIPYSEAVVVGGSIPYIDVSIGSMVTQATYYSGSTTASLVFRHIVQSGEIDIDSIVMNSPIMNGGTLKDLAGNLATLVFTPPTIAGVNVDGIIPNLLGVNIVSGTYSYGGVISITATFSENVSATGLPKLPLQLSTGTVMANYSSTTGSLVQFTYTVGVSDYDMNGDISSGNTINLTAGTIKDTAGNITNLSFGPNTHNGVYVDGSVPNIIGLAWPANSTYINSATLVITATFSESVSLTGTPSIGLQLTSGTVQAYAAAGTSTTFDFKHVVTGTDLDTNGIATVGTYVLLNGGTIKDSGNNNALLNFTNPNLSAVNVDGVLPTISQVYLTSGSQHYKLGDTLVLSATFNESVVVSGGPPRILIGVGTLGRWVNYSSGSNSSVLTFNYTVLDTDEDIDNTITVGSLVDLNGGTIKDVPNNAVANLGFTSPSVTGFYIDGKIPNLANVFISGGTYLNSNTIVVSATYSESVSITGVPKLPLLLSSGTVMADYVSVSSGSILIFNYTIGSSDYDWDGSISSGTSLNLTGGTIKDTAGNITNLNFGPNTHSGVYVDGSVPNIIGLAWPSSGTYMGGTNLVVTATFSESVALTGTPSIDLQLTSGTVKAYTSAGTGTTFSFTHSIGASDVDNDGIATEGTYVLLNGGSIKDLSGNNALLNFANPSLSSVKVDGVVPTIISGSITYPSANTYIIGGTLDFTIPYSEAVVVGGSIPYIDVSIGSMVTQATYYSGSTTASLVFRHIVQSGEIDIDSIVMNSPIMNGGTLKDLAGNLATLVFTPPTIAGVNVDGIIPNLLGVNIVSGTYSYGGVISITATFSENVSATGLPKLPLQLSTGTVMANYSSTTGSLVQFTYTVGVSDYDMNGDISSGNTINLTAGTIKDTAGNITNLSFGPNTHNGVYVDGSVPNIIGLAWPANSTYINSATLVITATFSESVSLTGTPSIGLQLTSGTVQAYAAAGTSTTFDFKHVVTGTDLDTNGIATVGTYVLLNGGTIKDSGNNNALLNFTNPNLSAVNVDGVLPTISQVYLTSGSQHYKLGDTLVLSATFNESVVVSGGPPRILIGVGTLGRWVNYSSGSNSSVLTFNYTVLDTDEDIDNTITVGSLVDLNGGTIKDVPNNAVANLGFTSPSVTGFYIDGVLPLLPSSFNDGLASISLINTPLFSWTASASTDLAKYQIAFGTTQGGSDTSGGWFDISSASTSFGTLGSFVDSNSSNLHNIYFASLKVFDLVGNVSAATYGDGWNLIQWQKSGELTVSSATAQDFGKKVLISENGNVMAVGSPDYENNGNGAGRILMFVRNSTNNTWVSAATLSAEYWDSTGGTLVQTIEANDHFGENMDITELAGGSKPLKLVVGLPKKNSGEGLAIVFHCSFENGASPSIACADQGKERLTSGTVSAGSFGSAVAVSGTLLSIGAPAQNFDIDGDLSEEIQAGVVHKFVSSGTYVFASVGTLYSTLGTSYYHFGQKLLLDQDRLIIADGNSSGALYSTIFSSGSFDFTVGTIINVVPSDISEMSLQANNSLALVDMSTGSGVLKLFNWSGSEFATSPSFEFNVTGGFKALIHVQASGLNYLAVTGDKCVEDTGPIFKGCLNFYKKLANQTWVIKPDAYYSAGQNPNFSDGFGFSVTSGGEFIMVGAPASDKVWWFH